MTRSPLVCLSSALILPAQLTHFRQLRNQIPCFRTVSKCQLQSGKLLIVQILVPIPAECGASTNSMMRGKSSLFTIRLIILMVPTVGMIGKGNGQFGKGSAHRADSITLYSRGGTMQQVLPIIFRNAKFGWFRSPRSRQVTNTSTMSTKYCLKAVLRTNPTSIY